MLKVVCVDDEKLMLKQIVSLCEKTADVDEIHCFDRAKKALSWVKDHSCDLALLDINLPDMNGITLAKRIRELRPETDIVFVAGCPQYAVDAWSVHPKPDFAVESLRCLVEGGYNVVGVITMPDKPM